MSTPLHDYQAEKLYVKAFPISVWPNLQILQSRSELFDVTLKVGATRIPAHRVILAMSVPYFNHMLLSGMTEARQEEIIISGVEGEALSCCIDFVYKCELTVTIANIQSIMECANYLQMTELTQLCCSYAIKHLNANNCLELRDFGDMISCGPLVKSASSFLNQHFVEVAKSDAFLSLTKEQVISIISREELHVRCEEQVFLAAMKWIWHKFEDRWNVTYHLLKHIRLPILKQEFLTNTVQNDEAVMLSFDCCELVNKTLELHRSDSSDCPRDMLVPRLCTELQNVIFRVGGLDNTHSDDPTNVVDKFCPLSNKLDVVSKMPTNKFDSTAVFVGRQLYVLGGRSSHGDDLFSNAAIMYCPDSGKWSDVAQMLTPRAAFNCAAYREQILVCSGVTRNDKAPSCCEMYNTTTKLWRPIDRLLPGRRDAAVTVFCGSIHILGGDADADWRSGDGEYDGCPWDLDGGIAYYNPDESDDSLDGDSPEVPLSYVESYSEKQNRWVRVTPMLSSRCRHAAATLRNLMFVFGGENRKNKLHTGEVYDVYTDQWTSLPQRRIPGAIRCITLSQGKLFCFSDHDEHDINIVEVYDPEQKLWLKSKRFRALRLSCAFAAIHQPSG